MLFFLILIPNNNYKKDKFYKDNKNWLDEFKKDC